MPKPQTFLKYLRPQSMGNRAVRKGASEVAVESQRVLVGVHVQNDYNHHSEMGLSK
jgi:hypothetical protein